MPDCQICQFDVDGPPNGQANGFYIANRARLGTPGPHGIGVAPACQHDFHGSCLQQWLRVQMNCPVCRTIIPNITMIYM